MENKKKKHIFSGFFASLIFAAELFFISDMALTRSNSNMPPILAITVFAAAFVGMFFFSRINPKIARRGAYSLFVLMLTALIAGGMLWYGLYKHGVYADEDNGKMGLYQGRRVMVLVPHQDDEINLLGGVLEHLDEIDEAIAKQSRNWSPDRMPKVDLTIMRMAVWELLYEEDVPGSVVINEAVEIAKRFCDDGADRFINGVLGTILREKEAAQQ